MDRIILEAMTFFAYHGLTEQERQNGQEFEVEAEIFLDLKPAGQSDDINDSVDYHKLYIQIEEIVTKNKYFLLEALAEKIAASILTNQVVEKVVIRVRKTSPPIAGQIKSSGVEVSRERRQ